MPLKRFLGIVEREKKFLGEELTRTQKIMPLLMKPRNGERWTPELGLEFMLTRTITDGVPIPKEYRSAMPPMGGAPNSSASSRNPKRARASSLEMPIRPKRRS